MPAEAAGQGGGDDVGPFSSFSRSSRLILFLSWGGTLWMRRLEVKLVAKVERRVSELTTELNRYRRGARMKLFVKDQQTTSLEELDRLFYVICKPKGS